MEVLKSVYDPGRKALLHKTEHLPVSSMPSTGNLTGSWRTLHPVFREGTGPCSEACPNHTDIPKALWLFCKGKLRDALEVVRRDNPLPAVTGRVCPHFCEGRCNRGEFDFPINVHALERFIGDYGLDIPMEKRNARTKGKTAVVGSGPAGLSAAYFLATRGVEVTVFDRLHLPGGMLRYGIPEYRLPRWILDREVRNILGLGIRFQGEREVTPRDVESMCGEYDFVIFAPGLWGQSIPADWGYRGKRVVDALRVLREVHSGRLPDLGERIFVVGGGNTALDVTRMLMRLGKQVSVVYRRTLEEAPVLEEEILEAREEEVRIQERTLITHIEENPDGSLRVETRKAVQRGGRVVPEGPPQFHTVDAVVAAVGQEADTKVERNEKVLTSGDYDTREGTVAQAVASGKRAAFSILRKLGILDDVESGASSETSGGMNVIPYDRINTSFFRHEDRAEPARRELRGRAEDFGEVVEGLTLEESLKEANRCFCCGTCTQCGTCWYFCPDACVINGGIGVGKVAFDRDFCKGCAICSVVCPRGCIAMEEESWA